MNAAKQFWQGFRKGVRTFGEIVGTLVNSVLLTLVYFMGIGIPALIAKLISKHFLERRLAPDQKSYWQNLHLKRKPIEDYYRQF